MIIGKFQPTENGYHGLIPAFTNLQVAILRTDQKGVDYAVTVADGIGLGVGWTKTSVKGNEYVSIKLDSPLLSAPINCSLVKQSDGHALIWDRQKPKAEPTTV